MRHDYPIIDCDVLIIGGGSACPMAAAIRAKISHAVFSSGLHCCSWITLYIKQIVSH